ncbi:MAG: XdhC family protein [Deltaproteobacteria bacterium]|nr:XdhC family protein [Deltaproteobacteria bacterium]
MKDSLAELIDAAAAQREPYVVATVVRVHGSSYRRPGARLLATRDGQRIAGSISGGCLEGALLRTAWWRTEHGPALVEFDSSDPDTTDGVLGCGGVVEVLVERVAPGEGPLAFAARMIDERRRGAIATVFATTRAAEPIGRRWLVAGATADDVGRAELPGALVEPCTRAMLSGKPSVEDVGPTSVLVEPIVPPLELFVFGGGLDAVPIVEHARQLGWLAHVCPGSPRFEHATRFAAAESLDSDLAAACAEIDRADRAAAIIMNHDLRRDAAALHAVLATRARYIGVLGPRHRTESLLCADELADPRLHAPVGLDLGAETPAEIALAVAAEVLADDRAATARALRDRKAAATPSRA